MSALLAGHIGDVDFEIEVDPRDVPDDWLEECALFAQETAAVLYRTLRMKRSAGRSIDQRDYLAASSAAEFSRQMLFELIDRRYRS